MEAERAEIHPLYVTEPESDEHPMSVGLFKQLSRVSGFLKANKCSNYDDYIVQWMIRRGTEDPRSPKYDAALELLRQFTAAALQAAPFATVTTDGRESAQTLDPLPPVIDNTVLYAFLDRLSTEPLEWTSNGHWRNDGVRVLIHPTAMLLVEWSMVLAVETGAALQPVIEQFARWVQSACTDTELQARARALCE